MTGFLGFIRDKWLVFTLITLAFITFASLWPLPEFPEVPGNDKIHHLIAYAILIFPAALRKPKKQAALGLLFLAYSGLIELLQPFVNRYGEWMDLAANATGLICGLIIAALIKLVFPDRKNLH